MVITSFQNPRSNRLVYVLYIDHVLYNRVDPLVMSHAISARKSLEIGYGSVCRRRVCASVCHVALGDIGRHLHMEKRRRGGRNG